MAVRKNLINSEELKSILHKKNIKILDSRWFLNKPSKGLEDFKKSHIPNAIFFDIDKNSNKKKKLPHMLPGKLQFENFLNKNGITQNNLIIIYDQEGFFHPQESGLC